jgi:hypothetical protein
MTSANYKRLLQDPDTTRQTESPERTSPDPKEATMALNSGSSSKGPFSFRVCPCIVFTFQSYPLYAFAFISVDLHYPIHGG